ncbi:MAG: OadG family protein [Clostridiales bacterium]|nr:OadG family protein [Clostridiales bacterium]
MNPALIQLSVEDGLRQYELGEALGVALFVWAIVFCVLFIIFVCIRIFGMVVSSFSKKPATAPVDAPVPAAAPSVVEDSGEEFSSGSLKLKGCDEKTAAMIMAIVSDNTGIPLSELIFKSITLVEEK